jgi:hypothetical protein
MKEIIASIIQKHEEGGIDIHLPANFTDIIAFEKEMGFPLPTDFKAFYAVCNGFSCNEDIFNMIPLFEIRRYPQDYGRNWFYFSEYMIYSDMWGLRFTASGKYEIFNESYPDKAMTSALEAFLIRFLKGNVFETGGLYEWYDELEIK